MKTITIDRDTLVNHIKALGSKKGGKTRAQEAIRFTAAGNRKIRMIIANPFESTARSVLIPARANNETPLTVSRSQFQAALEMAPKGKLTITVTGNKIDFGGGVSITTQAMDYEDCTYELHSPDAPLVLAASTFQRMIADVSHAICNDGTKYNLCNVFFQTNSGKLNAVATDGHRLAIASRPFAGDFNLMVPNSILTLAKPLIKGTEEGSVSFGIHAPPPPPKEYRDVYKGLLPNGMKESSYDKDSYFTYRDKRQQECSRYETSLETAEGDRVAYLQELLKDAKAYLACLDAFTMETKEVIKTAPRYFVMSWGDYTLVEKLHDIGEFPDYTRAIPVKEPVGVFRMDAKELLSIVKQCPCPDKFTGVYLEFTESNCKVSGQDIGKEIEIVRDIPCEADVFIGTQVRLMQRYLADVLKVIGGEVVIILSDEAGLSPVKLQDADDDGRLFVIMPMRQ